ncbi:hypothetical protein [Bovine papular stomatitis virus]
MAGIRSCQKRNVTAAPPFQKPLKIKSSGFQHSDFDFNPRPPPPTQDEIDTFCVDMRTAPVPESVQVPGHHPAGRVGARRLAANQEEAALPTEDAKAPVAEHPATRRVSR